MKAAATEAMLAATVSAFLAADGAEVFHEVTLEWKLRRQATVGNGRPVGDGRADLAFLRGAVLGVVECKMSLSFELLAQAARWRDYAHEVWIAVPFAKMSEGRHEAFQVCRKHYGFGVIEVQDDDEVRLRHPVQRATIDPALLNSLRPEHKTGGELAGTNRGGHFTTFKETAARWAAYVAAHPGAKAAEIAKAVPHHYYNANAATAALTRTAKKKLAPGLHIGWRQGIYPTEESARTGGVG